MMQHHQQLEGEEVVSVCAVCGTVFLFQNMVDCLSSRRLSFVVRGVRWNPSGI